MEAELTRSRQCGFYMAEAGNSIGELILLISPRERIGTVLHRLPWYVGDNLFSNCPALRDLPSALAALIAVAPRAFDTSSLPARRPPASRAAHRAIAFRFCRPRRSAAASHTVALDPSP